MSRKHETGDVARLRIDGHDYVVVPRDAYDRLVRLARIGARPGDAVHELPAGEYARASIAREILRRRSQAGLTQGELATRAGLRVETLCRIEKGRNVPTTRTIAAIEAALAAAEHKQRKKRPA